MFKKWVKVGKSGGKMIKKPKKLLQNIWLTL